MPTILNDAQYAVAESTFAVQMSFFDDMDLPVTPTQLSWSLVNEHGSVVNTRADVVVPVPAETVTFVLSGPDLVYSDGRIRTIIVKGTYDSTLGNGLSIADSLTFKVMPLFTKKC